MRSGPGRHRPDASLDHPLGTVAVPNQTITPIRQLESLHSCQERLGLQLHSLSQKPSSPRAQDIRQRILELFGLTHRNFGVRQRSPGELFGRPDMIWVAIIYLAALAITLEGMHRAPELD